MRRNKAMAVMLVLCCVLLGCSVGSIDQIYFLDSLLTEDDRTSSIDKPVEDLEDGFEPFALQITDLKLKHYEITGMNFYYEVQSDSCNANSQAELCFYFADHWQSVFEGEPTFCFPLELKDGEVTTASGMSELAQKYIDLISSGDFALGVAMHFEGIEIPSEDPNLKTTITITKLAIEVLGNDDLGF